MSVAEFNNVLLSNAVFLKPFAFTLTRDNETAKDLFQETLYKALVNKDKYNTGTNVRAWLYTIMRNIFINDYRRASRHHILFAKGSNDFGLNTNQGATVNGAMSKINISEIQEAIHHLPDIFKSPFVLYFDGFKYHEISELLGEPLGTIKSRIHFARKLLKAQIERS